MESFAGSRSRLHCQKQGKRKKPQSPRFPLCLEDIFLNSIEIPVWHFVCGRCRWTQIRYMAGARQQRRLRNAVLGGSLQGEIKGNFIDSQKPSMSPFFKGLWVHPGVCSSKLGKARLPPFNCCPHSQAWVPLLTNIPAGSCWACWEGKHSLHAPSTIDILPFLAFPTGVDSRDN